jgi:hypothetical protein
MTQPVPLYHQHSTRPSLRCEEFLYRDLPLIPVMHSGKTKELFPVDRVIPLPSPLGSGGAEIDIRERPEGVVHVSVPCWSLSEIHFLPSGESR